MTPLSLWLTNQKSVGLVKIIFLSDLLVFQSMYTYYFLNVHVQYDKCTIIANVCIVSACILSNETVNIWSHMLGLIYFTLLQINDNFHFLPENGADAGDHFTFTVMNLCFQVRRVWRK